MARELLVRIKDKTHPDPEFDAIVTKRGDVIAAKQADIGWGTEEYANPEWRIIRVNGLSPDEANGMLTGEAASLHNPQAPRRKRIVYLDVDALGLDATPNDSITDIDLASFRKARKTKKLVDP
jgi:hypothetical protein